MRIRTLIPLSLPLFLALMACKKKEPSAPEAVPTVTGPTKAEEVPTPAPTVAPAKDDDAVAEAIIKEHAPDDDAEASEAEMKAGKTYEVMQGDLVVVMNAKPVDDGTWRFPAGSACRIDPTSTVKAIGQAHDDENDQDLWLVRYTREPAAEAMKPMPAHEEYEEMPSQECPDGTVFFLEDTGVLLEDDGKDDPRLEQARKLLQQEPLPGTYKVHR